MPKEIILAHNSMILAKMYNAATGASLTHWDIDDMGYIEREVILAALEI